MIKVFLEVIPRAFITTVTLITGNIHLGPKILTLPQWAQYPFQLVGIIMFVWVLMPLIDGQLKRKQEIHQ